jgi:monoamine oxidase
MAGLTASLALLRAGHDVTILEAQDRVGGRLLSVDIGAGQVSEAGGGHFRSNMPYVLHYIRQFGLPLRGLNDGLPTYVVKGQRIASDRLAEWPLPLAPEERGMTVASNLWRALVRAGLDTDTVLDRAWPSDPALMAKLDGLTLGALLRENGASEAFLDLLDAHGGAGTRDGHALSSLPDLAYHFGDQTLFRVAGGNEKLPRALAATIGAERIALGCRVVAIDQSGGTIRVRAANGREFAADAVISTLASTVLQDIAVTPGWSGGKQRMLGAVEWEKTVKVIVQTRSPAWLAQGMRGWPVMGGDRPWERIIDITGNEPGGRGNIFFYLNGANAAAVQSQPAATRAQAFVEAFRAEMPGFIDETTFTGAFAWGEQPWIRGSFGLLPVGGGWMIEEWTRPEGRIHFAGDWTTLKSGWVEGAIESGLRAARQIDPAARAEGNPRIRQEGL